MIYPQQFERVLIIDNTGNSPVDIGCLRNGAIIRGRANMGYRVYCYDGYSRLLNREELHKWFRDQLVDKEMRSKILSGSTSDDDMGKIDDAKWSETTSRHRMPDNIIDVKIRNQGAMGSSVAHSLTSCIEYMHAMQAAENNNSKSLWPLKPNRQQRRAENSKSKRKNKRG